MKNGLFCDALLVKYLVFNCPTVGGMQTLFWQYLYNLLKLDNSFMKKSYYNYYILDQSINFALSSTAHRNIGHRLV